MTKERVDALAYKQGLFETREQAKGKGTGPVGSPYGRTP